MDSKGQDSSAEDAVKVTLYNSTEIKIALDDHVKAVLTKPERFRESHRYENLRLVLGFAACIVAVGGALYGYFTPWERAKTVTAFSVIWYTAISSALTGLSWLVDSDLIFQGTKSDASYTLRVGSRMRKHSEIYELRLERYTNAQTQFAVPWKSQMPVACIQESSSCEAFFNTDGLLVPDKFEHFVMNNLQKLAALVNSK